MLISNWSSLRRRINIGRNRSSRHGASSEDVAMATHGITTSKTMMTARPTDGLTMARPRRVRGVHPKKMAAAKKKSGRHADRTDNRPVMQPPSQSTFAPLSRVRAAIINCYRQLLKRLHKIKLSKIYTPGSFDSFASMPIPRRAPSINASVFSFK